MRVAVLSPYHGGSHAVWANGLACHSEHQLELHTLPARFWKWRMHGGAITLARALQAGEPPQVIVATDMLDLTTLLALTRRRTAGVPVILYMHENQLTYPLPADGADGPMRRQHGERDRHYGFINFASMLAADRVVFNSGFHRQAVLDELPRFLRHFPEHREIDAVETIAARSSVLPVGIETREAPEEEAGADAPLVLWNQRWEYDKNPAAFFAALQRMANEGLPFRVAVCGESFSRQPHEFESGIAALGDRVIHRGLLPRDDYLALLQQVSIVISTSLHEFFGIAVLEAICAGALPLLPARLSYPEILPKQFHAECLYSDQTELETKLRAALLGPRQAQAAALAKQLRARYAWRAVAPRYDRLFEATAAGR